MSDPKLAFIGSGNMTRSIVGGLVAQGYPASAISVSNRSPEKLRQMASDFGVQTGDNHSIARTADVVILAVKPQGLKAVAEDLHPVLIHQPLVMSIAAGIDCASLSRWLGEEHALVRCMPNTPSLVQAGASGLYANGLASEAQHATAERIMSAVGRVFWLEDESLLDAVTAVSGSGPAYFFLVMEAMIDAGVALGLEPEMAKDLTLQTALGAAQLAGSSDVLPGELRRRVMSPGGTTEAAIQVFEDDNLRAIFKRAMIACAERSKALAKELGQ